MQISRFIIECVDTPGWDDGSRIKYDCGKYRRVFKCAENLIGELYNYPEQNCCGCGKERQGKPNIPNISMWPQSYYFFNQF